MFITTKKTNKTNKKDIKDITDEILKDISESVKRDVHKNLQKFMKQRNRVIYTAVVKSIKKEMKRIF